MFYFFHIIYIFITYNFFLKIPTTNYNRKRKYRRGVNAFVRDNTGPAGRIAATITTNNNESTFALDEDENKDENEDNVAETIEETDVECEEETTGNDWNPKTWKQHREEQMMKECVQSRNTRQALIKTGKNNPTVAKRKHVDSDDDETIKSPNVSVANTPTKNKHDDDVHNDNLLDGYSETSPEILVNEKKNGNYSNYVFEQKLLNAPRN